MSERERSEGVTKEEQAEARVDRQDGGHDEAGCPGVAALVDAVEPLQHEPEASPKDHEPSKPPWNWDRIFSGIVALFTIVLAVETGLQWDATRDAVNVAADANRESRDALAIANRAWVKAKVDRLPEIRPYEPISVTVRMENVGNVPARDMLVLAALWPANATDVVCRDDIVIYQEHGSRTDFAPKGTSEIIVDATLDKGFVDGLMSDPPTKALYVVGRFAYINGFKENGETRFCARWDSRKGAFMAGAAGNTMR